MKNNNRTNLYLDPALVDAAKKHVEGNRKVRSLSGLVTMLVVRELRAKRVKLPEKFATK